MTRIVVIFGFLVSFAAGIVVGLEARRAATAAASPATRPTREGWLAKELGLSNSQQEQLKKIWSETARRGGREQDDRRRQARKERDDAIAALIPAENKPRFEQVMKTHSEKMAALERELRSSYQNAVERTRQILTPAQREKYEEILRRHEAERAARDRERDQRRLTEEGGTTRRAPPAIPQ